MKVGIDSFSYHRWFGEIFLDQEPAPEQWNMDDFLKRANELDVDGVSLESCYFPRYDEEWLARLKTQLDEYGLDRVYAWGHPDGLEGGKNQAAFQDMMDSIPRAKMIGAEVMRTVGSSLAFRHEPHDQQIAALIDMFKRAVEIAEEHEIKLAVETHVDFNSDEMLQIIEGVDSPYLGVTFDTGNLLRVWDDPLKGMEKLAPHVYATHIKDLMPIKGAPVDEWYFFSSVPVGEGCIDNERLAELLNEAGYTGFLAVEIDNPIPEWSGREDEMVRRSITELRRIAERFS